MTEIELATITKLHTQKKKLKNLKSVYDDVSKKPDFTLNDILSEIVNREKKSDQLKKKRFIDDLKLLPLSIDDKEKILEKAYPRTKIDTSENVSCMNFTYLISKAYTNSIRKIKEIFSIFFSPLENQIIKIERNFGKEISSYFKDLKSLLLSNLFVSFFIFIPFLLVPHILVLDREIKSNKSFEYCTGLNESYTKFNPLDLILPNNAILLGFYGCFTNQVQTFLSSNPKSYYNMQYAYLLTFISYLLFWLYKTSTRSAKIIRCNLVHARLIRDKTLFSETLFTSWQYGLQKLDAADQKKKELFFKFSDYMTLLRKRKKRVISNAQVTLIIFANGMFLILAAGILSGIYFFITNYVTLIKSAKLEKFYEVVLAIGICLLNFIVPIICSLLAKIENLANKSTESIVKIVRILVIQITATFFVFYSSISSLNEKCFESSVASLVLTFVIVDLLFYFIFDVIIVTLKHVFRKVFKLKYKIEFDISYYTFSIINSQSFIWIGTYFSPFLSIINVFIILIKFGFDTLLVQKFFDPSKKLWSASKISTVFSLITMITFFLTFIGMGYFSIQVESSKNCGPFNELNYTKPIDYLFKLKNNIENSNEILKAIILVITSPGLIAFLLFILVGGTFTSYSLMSSYKESIELLNRAHEENKLKRKEYNEKLKQIKRNVNMKRISRSARQTMIMNEMMHEIDNLISENETNDNNENFNSFNDIQIESESRERSSVRRSDKSKIYDLDEDLQI